MADLYSVQPNPKGRGFDVIRYAPTIISSELKQGEAEALACALNETIRLMEKNK